MMGMHASDADDKEGGAVVVGAVSTVTLALELIV